MSHGLRVYSATGKLLIDSSDANRVGAVYVATVTMTKPEDDGPSSAVWSCNFPDWVGEFGFFEVPLPEEALASAADFLGASSVVWSYPGGIPTLTVRFPFSFAGYVFGVVKVLIFKS